MLTNYELRKLIQHVHKDELFDITGKENKYIQYNNDDQHYTSEREYLLGGLLATTDPSLVLEFPTFKDIFKIKESSGGFKTKAQKLAFINELGIILKDLPYSYHNLKKIQAFLEEQRKMNDYKVSRVQLRTANIFLFNPAQCSCAECEKYPRAQLMNSLAYPAAV